MNWGAGFAALAATVLAGCGQAATTLAGPGGGSTAAPTFDRQQIHLSDPSAIPTAAPVIPSVPKFADDPTVVVTLNKSTSLFTIVATNASAVVCHRMTLSVLGEAGYNPQPTEALKLGNMGIDTEYKDVAAGAAETRYFDASSQVRQLSQGERFAVGAVGYCQDSRG